MVLTKTPICNFGEKANAFKLKGLAFSPKLQIGVLVKTIMYYT